MAGGSLGAALLVAAVSAASDMTPDDSLARLKAGNARFSAAPSEPVPLDAERRLAAREGQHPMAAVLSCADARVPPELIFRAALGELFVVRSAGPVSDQSVLASIEYALGQLHAPLLVVMGHDACDTVKSAIDTPAGQSLGPNLDYLVKRLRPSVNRSNALSGEARLRGAILENVEEQINDLLAGSEVIRHLAEDGSVGIVGAYYELGSGVVHFTERVKVPPTAAAATPAKKH